MKNKIIIILDLILIIVGFILVLLYLRNPHTFHYQSTTCPLETIELQKVYSGVASYYDYDIRREDQKCRTDDCYSMTHNTCASRDFPRGTVLIVYTDDRFTTVIVNDYGPAESTGRIIDLSSAAFGDIGSFRRGLVDVKIKERR